MIEREAKLAEFIGYAAEYGLRLLRGCAAAIAFTGELDEFATEPPDLRLEHESPNALPV